MAGKDRCRLVGLWPLCLVRALWPWLPTTLPPCQLSIRRSLSLRRSCFCLILSTVINYHPVNYISSYLAICSTIRAIPFLQLILRGIGGSVFNLRWFWKCSLSTDHSSIRNTKKIQLHGKGSRLAFERQEISVNGSFIHSERIGWINAEKEKTTYNCEKHR